MLYLFLPIGVCLPRCDHVLDFDHVLVSNEHIVGIEKRWR